LRAIAATGSLQSQARATSITVSTDVVLPGSATHGRTRSRCPHAAQAARRPSRRSAPRKRLNHVRVSLNLPRPQLAQRQPSSIAEVAVAISAT
jgi:hypothetical protein